jgi:hypothetical protein
MLREAQEGIDLNDLGETPRLGLAVVGRLAQAYGFQVSLRPSAYGGVRAVLIVPQDLLTATPATTERAHGIGVASGPRRAVAAIPRPALASRQTVTASAVRPPSGPQPWESERNPAMTEQNPAVTERAANGLPQRRRHAAASRPVPAPPAPPAEQPEQPGMWLAAFANGVNGRPDHHSDESSGKGEQ